MLRNARLYVVLFASLFCIGMGLSTLSFAGDGSPAVMAASHWHPPHNSK